MTVRYFCATCSGRVQVRDGYCSNCGAALLWGIVTFHPEKKDDGRYSYWKATVTAANGAKA